MNGRAPVSGLNRSRRMRADAGPGGPVDFEPILEPLGTLIFQIDYQRLVERHFRPESSTATELFVLSGSRMLYRPASESLQRFEIAAIPLTGSTGSLLQHINGKPYFLAYKQSPATGWTYISVIPYDEVFQEKKCCETPFC